MRLPGGEEHHGPHKEQRVCEATPIDEDAPFTLSTIRTVLFFNSYKYLLSPCSVPGTVLSTWDMEIHKRNRVSASTDPKFL